MIPLPEDIGWSDIRQWLHDGWFLFRPTAIDELRPGCLSEDIDRPHRYNVCDLDGREFPFLRGNVFPCWPKCGAVNMDGYAAYIERIPQRVYRRTYNINCVKLSIPRKWDVMKRVGTGIGELSPLSKDVVKAVFKPIYYRYSQATEMMDTGQAVSVALTPYLVVAGGTVYYRNNLVANIEDGKITPMAKQEVTVNRILKFFEGRVRL